VDRSRSDRAVADRHRQLVECIDQIAGGIDPGHVGRAAAVDHDLACIIDCDAE